MGFYRDRLLPRLLDGAMKNRMLKPYRERVVGAAEGRVLEIGAGSGMNFRYYGAGTGELMALEPDPNLTAMARERAEMAGRPVRFLAAGAEAIPLEDASVDTVVTTWTLCSIADAGAALKEMRRVLKPSGRLLFVEHGRAPEAGVARWQNRINPVWKRIAGGCNLNRPIPTLIEAAGFRVEALSAGYAPEGPKIMTYLYEGAARVG
jgi:ubiquinone/menaquinone biosynthesis C-methylase UbiE